MDSSTTPQMGGGAKRFLSPRNLAWIFGVLFAFGAGRAFADGQVISGLALAAAVAVVLPPAYAALAARIGRSMSRGWRVVLAFALVGLAGPLSVDDRAGEAAPPAAVSNTPEPSPSVDVPSLVGKSLAQIKETLGAPDDASVPTPLQMQVMGDDATWTNEYSDVNGATLLVTFNPRTGIVEDLFLSPAGGDLVTDVDSLLGLGGLRAGDPRYALELVEALKGGGYTGVIVRPR